MCERTPNGRAGWRGWRQWSEAAPLRPTGPWHDLSRQLHDELPIPHVTRIDMACHIGVDFATPDPALPQRTPGFDWPVHQVLLSGARSAATEDEGPTYPAKQSHLYIQVADNRG